jgi:hypothetical protein
MRKILAVLAAVAVAALVVSGVATAGKGGRPLTTALTGAAERPVLGDPDATGQATVRLNQGRGEVCFDVSWADVAGEVFAAHIHVAPAGSPGPIVVPLFSGSFAGTDELSDCVHGIDRSLIKAIRKDPSAYYVNVHSMPGFEGGAIRGQLSK